MKGRGAAAEERRGGAVGGGDGGGRRADGEGTVEEGVGGVGNGADEGGGFHGKKSGVDGVSIDERGFYIGRTQFFLIYIFRT